MFKEYLLELERPQTDGQTDKPDAYTILNFFEKFSKCLKKRII